MNFLRAKKMAASNREHTGAAREIVRAHCKR
jgi:hypothetical protein